MLAMRGSGLEASATSAAVQPERGAVQPAPARMRGQPHRLRCSAALIAWTETAFQIWKNRYTTSCM